MKGVSKEDKDKLAATMRQTNDYKDKQETARNPKSGGRSGGSDGGSFGGGNGLRASAGRPATVSAKYADLYDEWKAAGGSKSGQNWEQYRKSNAKFDSKDAKSANRKLQSQARGFIGRTEEKAREMSGIKTPTPDGVLSKSSESVGKSVSLRKRSAID